MEVIVELKPLMVKCISINDNLNEIMVELNNAISRFNSDKVQIIPPKEISFQNRFDGVQVPQNEAPVNQPQSPVTMDQHGIPPEVSKFKINKENQNG